MIGKTERAFEVMEASLETVEGQNGRGLLELHQLRDEPGIFDFRPQTILVFGAKQTMKLTP